MILVFTDLDGTLLDHETYSFEAARPALEALKRRGIPLILASSKTQAEMQSLSHALNIDLPLIVENGGGIANLPGKSASAPCYSKIRSVLDAMPRNIRAAYSGFGDWTVEEIAQRTGLSEDASALAATRQFSEPGIWSGSVSEFESFKAYLAEGGFKVVRGGRFDTIMGQTSKADAMQRLKEHYEALSGETVTTVALGDAPNDVSMLEAADHGFIVTNHAHTPLPELDGERDGRISRTLLPGPSGWNRAILDYLNEHTSNA